MDEMELKVISAIEKLKPQNGRAAYRDWLVTAALAAVGAIAFWYAIQTTKPKDVLQQVHQLQLEVDELKDELTSGTRPADVLMQVSALQDKVIQIQEIVYRIGVKLEANSVSLADEEK